MKAISKQLKALYKPSKVTYQTDLIEDVNYNIARISIVLLFIALLLTIVSFSLINNTVRLGIYAQRFSIHTMKLVGASWSFIRWPFVRNALLVGLLEDTSRHRRCGGVLRNSHNRPLRTRLSD